MSSTLSEGLAWCREIPAKNLQCTKCHNAAPAEPNTHYACHLRPSNLRSMAPVFLTTYLVISLTLKLAEALPTPYGLSTKSVGRCSALLHEGGFLHFPADLVRGSAQPDWPTVRQAKSDDYSELLCNSSENATTLSHDIFSEIDHVCLLSSWPFSR